MYVYYAATMDGEVVGMFKSNRIAEDFLDYQMTIADDPFEEAIVILKCEVDLFTLNCDVYLNSEV